MFDNNINISRVCGNPVQEKANIDEAINTTTLNPVAPTLLPELADPSVLVGTVLDPAPSPSAHKPPLLLSLSPSR